MEAIRISAKNLGSIAMPDFCPKCFWIKNKMKVPWQIFPGIFSSIDSYTKKIVRHIFDKTGSAPEWLPYLKDAKGYLKTLHWTKFQRLDPETNLIISGMEDDVFDFGDKGRMVVDYKTAKYTKNQDKLRPIYDVQLNFYGWIEEGLGNKVVPEFPLIYCEPVTEPDMGNYYTDGFGMPFAVKTVMIEQDYGLVDEILQKAADILFRVRPPAGHKDCKDCAALDNIFDRLGEFPQLTK